MIVICVITFIGEFLRELSHGHVYCLSDTDNSWDTSPNPHESSARSDQGFQTY